MEKRAFQRIKIDIDGAFILDSVPDFSREFIGTIEDISEGGIKIKADRASNETLPQKLAIGDSLHFTACDDLKVLDHEDSVVLTGEVEVVRIICLDNSIYIGCKIKNTSDDLKKYLSDKRLSLYLKML